MTDEKRNRIVEALKVLAEETDTDAYFIAEELIGLCWDDDFNSSPNEHPYKMYASVGILQEVVKNENVDLGTNYKEKYEELVELLKPHKLEDDMSPTTTLKMILKYHK